MSHASRMVSLFVHSVDQINNSCCIYNVRVKLGDVLVTNICIRCKLKRYGMLREGNGKLWSAGLSEMSCEPGHVVCEICKRSAISKRTQSFFSEGALYAYYLQSTLAPARSAASARPPPAPAGRGARGSRSAGPRSNNETKKCKL